MTAHGRAAAALAERGAAAVTRAHHVEQSAVAGDPAAIALLLEAATASAPRAPAAAARWYAAALRLQPEVVTRGRRAVAATGAARRAARGRTGARARRSRGERRATAPGGRRCAHRRDGRAARDAAERLGTLVALATCCGRPGTWRRAPTRLGEALALVPDDDVSTRVRLIAARAAAQHFLGRHEQANRQLDAALDALAGPRLARPPSRCCSPGSRARSSRSTWLRAARWPKRRWPIAERLGDPLLIGASAAALAHAQANAGNASGGDRGDRPRRRSARRRRRPSRSPPTSKPSTGSPGRST